MRISDWSSDVCSSDLEGSRADSAFRLEIGRTGSSSGGSAHGGVGGARRGGDRRGARGLAVRPRGRACAGGGHLGPRALGLLERVADLLCPLGRRREIRYALSGDLGVAVVPPGSPEQILRSHV